MVGKTITFELPGIADYQVVALV